MGKRVGTAKWYENQKRWQIKVQKDGERRTFTSSTPGRTGQREANAKADEWLDEDVVAPNVRIRDLYEDFRKEVDENAGTSMRRQVNSIGKVWILPALGNKKAARLCDHDIQRILDKAAAMGRSKKTIQDINGVINKFLKYCRRIKATTYRPEEVQIPASARLKGKSVLQPSDFIKLFNVDTYKYYGKLVREPYINAYRFAVLTGMRPGELRGLRREDVKGDRVFIRQAINDYGETTQGKNENAIRSFVMSKLAIQVMQDQLARWDGEFVFDMPSPEVYRRHWDRFCKHNDLQRITPYEMRHTFVSVVKRLPAGEVKPLVGHSADMDTFGLYGHALEGEDEELASSVNELFEKVLRIEK